MPVIIFSVSLYDFSRESPKFYAEHGFYDSSDTSPEVIEDLAHGFLSDLLATETAIVRSYTISVSRTRTLFRVTSELPATLERALQLNAQQRTTFSGSQ